MKSGNFLALDVGRATTGCAFASKEVRIALPMDPVVHSSDEELRDAIVDIAGKRNVSIIVLGLPLHTSGTEGEEAEHVRTVGSILASALPSCGIEYLDERFTSSQARKSGAVEEHTASAIILLETYLTRQSKR